jgi:hypothetical protein
MTNTQGIVPTTIRVHASLLQENNIGTYQQYKTLSGQQNEFVNWSHHTSTASQVTPSLALPWRAEKSGSVTARVSKAWGLTCLINLVTIFVNSRASTHQLPLKHTFKQGHDKMGSHLRKPLVQSTDVLVILSKTLTNRRFMGLGEKRVGQLHKT